MSNVQPLTTVGEASDLLGKLAAQAKSSPKGRKIHRPSLFDTDKVDPNGQQWIQALTKVFPDGETAAAALGVGYSMFREMMNGKAPIRKCMTLAAQKLLDDATKPEQQVAQTVALVVLPAEKAELLERAVRGAGGTFNALSFKGDGVALG